jgi:hypothetical protein
MMGLIGWSVAIPTLLGAALGVWLDKRHPGSHSWTLMLPVIGLAIGRRMPMNETAILVLSGGAGVLLGALFFGGLWWTVRRGLSSKRPASEPEPKSSPAHETGPD